MPNQRNHKGIQIHAAGTMVVFSACVIPLAFLLELGLDVAILLPFKASEPFVAVDCSMMW